MAKLTKDGYGQLELNQVAFRRDGRIEAQCKLADAIEYVENGMLLAVDNVSRTVKMPAADGAELIALNYTTEHMYDERTPGLKNFKLAKNTFLPRLGYLAKGDKFTTNTVELGTLTEENIKTKIAAGSVYGCESTDGYIALSETKPTGKSVILHAIAYTTMPDGQKAVKFQVIDC